MISKILCGSRNSYFAMLLHEGNRKKIKRMAASIEQTFYKRISVYRKFHKRKTTNFWQDDFPIVFRSFVVRFSSYPHKLEFNFSSRCDAIDEPSDPSLPLDNSFFFINLLDIDYSLLKEVSCR